MHAFNLDFIIMRDNMVSLQYRCLIRVSTEIVNVSGIVTRIVS